MSRFTSLSAFVGCFAGVFSLTVDMSSVSGNEYKTFYHKTSTGDWYTNDKTVSYEIKSNGPDCYSFVIN